MRASWRYVTQTIFLLYHHHQHHHHHHHHHHHICSETMPNWHHMKLDRNCKSIYHSLSAKSYRSSCVNHWIEWALRKLVRYYNILIRKLVMGQSIDIVDTSCRYRYMNILLNRQVHYVQGRRSYFWWHLCSVMNPVLANSCAFCLKSNLTSTISRCFNNIVPTSNRFRKSNIEPSLTQTFRLATALAGLLMKLVRTAICIPAFFALSSKSSIVYKYTYN